MKQDYLTNLLNNGVHLYGELIEKEPLCDLYKKILSKRNFDRNLFMDEDQYHKTVTNHYKTNPSKDYNFLNQFKSELELIESNPILIECLSRLLGNDYQIIIKKLICGVPGSWLPEWIKDEIADVNVANLGPYIKKEYRDITYFRGIDFHQDIIDWPKGKSDNDPSTFLTLYVYLHEVTKNDSPLFIIPKSHKLGATTFPHFLESRGGQSNSWKYSDDEGNFIECKSQMLIGDIGFTAIWHNCTLHGTQPIATEGEGGRLSLRYLFAKSTSNFSKTYIDCINDKISGNLNPLITRRDIDNKAKPIIKGNTINKMN